ncbi:MAG: EamA family transporter [Rhodocyclaceae bacterium]|nr:EamA family transporter [Rhodocyclaceae bacterium]
MPKSLSPRDFLLALTVVAIWGSNFVVIKYALADLPPLLFAALRFTLAFVPAALFLRRPRLAWSNLALYGVLIGVGQFGVLYIAMNGHISPGLASLVIQTQVFFTIAMAMRYAGETVKPYQGIALLLAVTGIGIIASHTDGTTTLGGLALILFAAFSWAAANMTAKRALGVNMLAYVVWSSVYAVPPLLLLSIAFEGVDAIKLGLHSATPATWLAVVWQSFGNTLFGYAVWGWLLARYPAATVTPMALLVPVFGMTASSFWLAEALPTWKLIAAGLVMSGLALNLLWPYWRNAMMSRG